MSKITHWVIVSFLALIHFLSSSSSLEGGEETLFDYLHVRYNGRRRVVAVMRSVKGVVVVMWYPDLSG